ncbi:MAG: hypothetical protein SAJ37_17990 [Oscillatoria sp. PMC 1068.18]|nr:hypothetical protein [Oscillatoria sp. PMC 1076.18]MEC4990626.1 hypothetical protein [Oscillatoria sp. PMC 1068.18]
MTAAFMQVHQEIYQNQKINVFHFVQGACQTVTASYYYVTIDSWELPSQFSSQEEAIKVAKENCEILTESISHVNQLQKLIKSTSLIISSCQLDYQESA